MEPISLPALKRELIHVAYFQPQMFLDSTTQGQVGALLVEAYPGSGHNKHGLDTQL